MVSVLILTKNEEQDLPGCLQSVSWCDDIHVFDSFSDDGTIDLATAAGATISKRKFDNWANHQNWAMANIPFKYPWVLYIDADERVSEGLYETLKKLDLNTPGNANAAYEIRRRDFAWNGRWLKHAQMSPYYLRLFRPDKMHYERPIHVISKPDGPIERIDGYLDHYPFSKGFKVWIARHLNYAEMEAAVRLHDLDNRTHFSVLKAVAGKSFSERRFHQKGIFYKMPGRPLIKWIYMVIIRRAFLDGKAGLTYATLQSIYEYFIIINTRELLAKQSKINK